MNPQSPVENPRYEFIRRNRVMLLFFALGCAFSIIPLVNSIRFPLRNKDYTHWHKFGTYARTAKPLYVDNLNGEIEYTYPPTAAVLFYGPLSNLPPFGFVLVLSLLNSLSWAFCVWASMVLVTGKWDTEQLLCSLLPGLAVAPYIWDIQFLGQLNLLLLALLLGSYLLMRRHRSVASSTLFGLAVAMKAFPLPAIAYFIVRRRWITTVGSIVSIVAFVWLLPGLMRGFDVNNAELKQWADMMVVDQSGESMGARSSIGFSRHNQSLISCSHRLLRHVNGGDGPLRPPLYVNLADISPKAAQLIGYGSCLILGLILLISCRFQFAPTLECEGLEMAMVITLVPLCSPLSWTYFYCWLLPAWAAVGYWINNPTLPPRVRALIKVGIGVAVVLLASALSEQIDPTLQACGVTAFGAVAIFLTLAWIRFHLPIPPQFATNPH